MTVTSWRARVTWSEAEPLVLQPGRIRASTDGAFDCCAAEQFVPAGADLLARKLASMLPLSIEKRDNAMLFADHVAAFEFYRQKPSRFKETDRDRQRRISKFQTWLRQTIHDVLSQVRLIANTTSILCPACRQCLLSGCKHAMPVQYYDTDLCLLKLLAVTM